MFQIFSTALQLKLLHTLNNIPFTELKHDLIWCCYLVNGIDTLQGFLHQLWNIFLHKGNRCMWKATNFAFV